MVRKTNIISLIGSISLLILFSCESPDQMSDAAYEKVKEEKMKSKDSSNNNVLIQEPVKTLVENKSENQDDWTKFKIEVENKMRSNENRIKEIKNKPNTSVKLFKKVSLIEKENSDLMVELNEFNKDAKIRCDKFKTRINQDLSDMSIELKDISKKVKSER